MGEVQERRAGEVCGLTSALSGWDLLLLGVKMTHPPTKPAIQEGATGRGLEESGGPVTVEEGLQRGSWLVHRHTELYWDLTTYWLCDLGQVNEPLWASISSPLK